MKKQRKSKVTDRWIAALSAIAIAASAFAGLATTAMAADSSITGSYDYDTQKFEWKIVEDTNGAGTFTTDADNAYADLTVQSDNSNNKLIASDNAVYFYHPSTSKGSDNNNMGYLKITPAVDGKISFGVYMTRTAGSRSDYEGHFRVAEADSFSDIFSDSGLLYSNNQNLGAPASNPINTTYTSPELSADKTYIIYTWSYYASNIDIKLSDLVFTPTTPIEKPETTTEPEVTAEPQMIFDIDFDDESITANIGAATEATYSGTYEESYNGTKAYKFNQSYLKPTKEDGTPLLTGLEEFTVSYWANMGTSKGWSFFAAPNTNAQNYQSETYIGILDNNTSITVERYNNSGSRPSNASKSGLESGWKHIVMVQSSDKSRLYIDGELATSVVSSYSVSSILGSSSVIQIGKGNWSGGEYATGLIDNYHIYNGALSADAVAELYNSETYDPEATPEPAATPSPVPEEGNLITNGSFSNGYATDWTRASDGAEYGGDVVLKSSIGWEEDGYALTNVTSGGTGGSGTDTVRRFIEVEPGHYTLSFKIYNTGDKLYSDGYDTKNNRAGGHMSAFVPVKGTAFGTFNGITAKDYLTYGGQNSWSPDQPPSEVQRTREDLDIEPGLNTISYDITVPEGADHIMISMFAWTDGHTLYFSDFKLYKVEVPEVEFKNLAQAKGDGDTVELNFVASAEYEGEDNVTSYGFWFVNFDDLKDTKATAIGDEALASGESFYYTTDPIKVDGAESVGFYAVPWVQFYNGLVSTDTKSGKAFTYAGALNTNGEVVNSNN